MEKWDGADGYRVLAQNVVAVSLCCARSGGKYGSFAFAQDFPMSQKRDMGTRGLRVRRTAPWRIDAFKIAAERMCGQALAT